jgi:Flp pilus assembly protein TadD
MATLYLERATGMDPGNAMAHTLLGRAYHATGRNEDADRQFAAARQLQSGTAKP